MSLVCNTEWKWEMARKVKTTSDLAISIPEQETDTHNQNSHFLWGIRLLKSHKRSIETLLVKEGISKRGYCLQNIVCLFIAWSCTLSSRGLDFQDIPEIGRSNFAEEGDRLQKEDPCFLAKLIKGFLFCWTRKLTYFHSGKRKI